MQLNLIKITIRSENYEDKPRVYNTFEKRCPSTKQDMHKSFDDDAFNNTSPVAVQLIIDDRNR